MREILTNLRLRWRALSKRQELERDLEDELAFHLAMGEEKKGEGSRRAQRLPHQESSRHTGREFIPLPSLSATRQQRAAVFGSDGLRIEPGDGAGRRGEPLCRGAACVREFLQWTGCECPCGPNYFPARRPARRPGGSGGQLSLLGAASRTRT